jgi:AcrR family transcriptional regulator
LKTQNLLKGDSARERILKTAIHLFNVKGIRATGVDTLIAESGVAKMTFYKHFSSKQALVMEYLKERNEIILNRLKAGVRRPDASIKEKLLSVFDSLKELCEDPHFRGCVFINAIVEARSLEAEEHLFSVDHKRNFHALLKETAQQGGIKNADEIADELFLLFQGAVVTAQIENSCRHIEIAKRVASRLL